MDFTCYQCACVPLTQLHVDGVRSNCKICEEMQKMNTALATMRAAMPIVVMLTDEVQGTLLLR